MLSIDLMAFEKIEDNMKGKGEVNSLISIVDDVKQHVAS